MLSITVHVFTLDPNETFQVFSLYVSKWNVWTGKVLKFKFALGGRHWAVGSTSAFQWRNIGSENDSPSYRKTFH